MMKNLDIGIRKAVEYDRVKYWLVIIGKGTVIDEDKIDLTVNNSPTSAITLFLQVIRSFYWKLLVTITIVFNTLYTMMYFWLANSSLYLIMVIIILMHIACFFYWIDFIGALVDKIMYGKKTNLLQTRSVAFLIIDAISLLPLSILYLIIVRDYDIALLWQLRCITLIRFYRLPRFFSFILTAERNHWQISVVAYSCYLVIFIVFFANIFAYKYYEYTPIPISEWNATTFNIIVVSLYYAVEMTLNVAYGDIMPNSYTQMLLVAIAMAVGGAVTMGIFTGVIGTALTNKRRRREFYRYEIAAIKNTLKARQIEKKIMEEILSNMTTFWKYKQGYNEPPPIHILPLSLIKEIYFDINFGLLHRSLIFSTQPRSFLRSVSVLMKNISYLPGDVILEPVLMSDVMICVASGVIEILSEANDESVLFSLTTGTIIGEATLFVPLPIRCVIRAATYVEVQVLMKSHFSRLALTYPEIYRNMRWEIFDRIQYHMSLQRMPTTSDDPSFTRRRNMKKFMMDLKSYDRKSEMHLPQRKILSLYVLSENIPRVNVLPINLTKTKWNLDVFRPDTSFMRIWTTTILIVVVFVAIAYPVWAGYYRTLKPFIYVSLTFTKLIYILDIYIECTTAIEKNDHFTFITSIKQIIAYKLKTFGFYLDIISAYYLSVYANLVWPEKPDYAHLLLSLNALLKTWRVIVYMHDLENDMRKDLLLVVTFKYALWMCLIIVWGAVFLYLEAHPQETFLKDRWFGHLEQEEVENQDPNPGSTAPITVSLYFATVTLFCLGYGDIRAVSVADCVCVVICIISGVTLFVAYVAEASACLKHLAIIKTTYQEELFATDQYMIEHEIPKEWRNKVRNYLGLQWDYDRGYSLKQNTMSNVLLVLQRQILTMDLTKTFLSVPLFRYTSHDFLKLLATICKIRVVPPDELIVEKGSFAREMYILENGYCQVLDETQEGTTTKTIGPVNPFGYVEMILGIPHRITVQTVTHARIVSLAYGSYLQAVTKYPGAKMEIDDLLEDVYIDQNDWLLGFKPLEETEGKEATVQKQRALLSKQLINVYKYHKTLMTSYWEPFTAWGKLRFCQFLLMPIVITPDSLFLRVWMTIRIVIAITTSLMAPIQFSLLEYNHTMMTLLNFLQGFAALDIYVMFHVGYYNSKGLLMFHPAKTSTAYLKGNFPLDFISVFPHYWFVRLWYPDEANTPNFVYKAPGLIMVLQIYKFVQACRYIENNILKNTDTFKILKFFPFAILVINFVAGFVVLLQCYKIKITQESELRGSQKLAIELAQSLKMFCLEKVPHNTTGDRIIAKMYLTTLYWVTATMTGCGYGDITPHNDTTMIAAMIIVVLGSFFFTYMFASINSNMVNMNVVISKYRTRIVEMSKFMRAENVKQDLIKRLIIHYEYNWQRTHGGSPQKVFAFVNSSLREKIMASMYEDTLSNNPVFENMEKAVIRIIGTSLVELYFLRGETIVKYKDVQKYIYIVYRGEVNLLTRYSRLITSMGKGGIFGNISNKPFSLSSETVVAADNVDLVRLDSKFFFSALKKYPDTLPLVNYLMSVRENYVEPREQKQAQESELKLNLFQTQSTFFDPDSISLNTGTKQLDGFHMNKTIYVPPGQSWCSFIVLPETKLDSILDIFICFMSYISVCISAYMFAFQDMQFLLLLISYALDFIFYLDFFLRFHVTVFDKYGDFILNMKTIRQRYIKSDKMYFHIASNLPLDLFAFAIKGDKKYMAMSILRLNRILRLIHIIDYFKYKGDKLMTNKVYLNIAWIIIMINLMTHFFACIWFIGVCPMDNCFEPSWVYEMKLQKKQKWELYFYSVFHIIIVTSTTGLAQLPIVSPFEVALDIIFMIICRFAVVILSGLLAAAINANSLTLFFYREKMTELKETFKRQNISEYQFVKMWKYLKLLWLRDYGKQMPKFLLMAPYAMRCEVMNQMFGKHLSQAYIFTKMGDAFLRQLSTYLKRYHYFAGNYIVQQGEIDNTMYFIHKGEVSVLTIHPDLMETIHFTLTENDHFGMVPGLVLGKAHSFSYRAATNAEIISLNLLHWRDLLKYFPDVKEKINEKLKVIASPDTRIT